MRIRHLAHIIAASTLVAAPVAVSAQPATNPAASLSIGKSVRASAPAARKSDLAGAGLIGLVILGGIAAIGVIAIINDSNSDSN